MQRGFPGLRARAQHSETLCGARRRFALCDTRSHSRLVLARTGRGVSGTREAGVQTQDACHSSEGRERSTPVTRGGELCLRFQRLGPSLVCQLVRSRPGQRPWRTLGPFPDLGPAGLPAAGHRCVPQVNSDAGLFSGSQGWGGEDAKESGRGAKRGAGEAGRGAERSSRVPGGHRPWPLV